MNLNKVFLIGRVTRDPETKSLPNGQQVTSFGLATDRYYKSKEGEKQKKTEFHNIVAFGRPAEIASQYLTKGSLVMIEGRLQTRNWEDASGVKKYKTEIIIENMQLGPKNLADGSNNSSNFEKKKESFSEPMSEKIPIVEEDEINPVEEDEINPNEIPF